MKYGLVLEGGAMRGMFTCGVMDVLLENQLSPDSVIGVSAGACFGCNYKSRQRGRAIRYNLRFCRDKRFCSFRSLITTGDLYGAEFCYHTVPMKLDIFDSETFREEKMSFYVVCTDVNTGQPVYHRIDEITYEELEWIRASASMPLASRIVEAGEHQLLDGGVTDSIPLRFMEENGFERNIVVLTQPRDYVKQHSRSEKLVKLAYRKYPELARAYSERPEMYNAQLQYVAEAEEQGRAFVIAPPEKLPIGHVEHDPDVLLRVYRIGRKTAESCIDDLKEFMKLPVEEV